MNLPAQKTTVLLTAGANSQIYAMARESVRTGKTGFAGYISGDMVVFRERTAQGFRKSVSARATEAEYDKLVKSVQNAEKQLKARMAHLEKEGTGDSGRADARQIFSSHLETLKDPVFLEEVRDQILNHRSSAAAAVQKITRKYIKQLRALDTRTFSEKSRDIEDLEARLLRELGSSSEFVLPEGVSIVWADYLRPEQIMALAKAGVKGFVLNHSSEASHDMIIIRALRIPTVFGIKYRQPKNRKSQPVIVDAVHGKLILDPQPETLSGFRELIREEKQTRRKLEAMPTGTETADRRRIQIQLNIELPEELDNFPVNQIDGIGLFRTEFMLMRREEFSYIEQVNTYRKVSQSVSGKPVTVRLFDIGGDKQVEDEDYRFFLRHHDDTLGIRAMRYLQVNSDLLQEQLKACIKSAADRPIRILIPMLSTREELLYVRFIISEICERESLPVPELGVMLETPASIALMPSLNEDVDFYSVGTNDLLQFLTAVDRSLASLKHIYNPMHPVLVDALSQIRRNASRGKRNPEVTICGEIAASPLVLPILIGLGFRSFSVSPVRVYDVKFLIHQLKMNFCRKLVKGLRNIYTIHDRETWVKEQLRLQGLP